MYSWNSATTFASASDWEDAFTRLHGAGRIRPAGSAGSSPARLEWQRTPAYGIARCSGTGESVSRDRRHIRSDPRGKIELIVPLSGVARVEQERSAAEIRPGQLALCDVDRPFTFGHDAGFQSLSFIMPVGDVAARSPGAVREPGILDGSHGLGRLVGQMLVTIQQEREELSGAAFDAACDHLLDLVALAADGATTSAPDEQRATVEAQIRRYVRGHAGDVDLDVTGIARAIGWSVRYVQQVMRAAGTTPRDLIRRERLELARTRLIGRSWARSSIARIAYASGFGSHAAFATAFRHEFGMTPTEARARQFTPAAPAAAQAFQPPSTSRSEPVM